MTQIRRRDALKGAAALLLASGAGGAPAASPNNANRAALTDPAEVNQVFRRMRFAGHEEIFFWWLRGLRYGLIDNELTPFFRMEVGSMHRCRELGDGRYSVTSLAAIYYTDLDKGDLVERWLNPVTNANVDFKYAPPKPSTVIYTHAGIESEPQFPVPGAKRRRELGPVDIVGGDVWLGEASHLLVPAQSNGTPALHVNDMYALHSPLRELANPRQKFVPCFAAFNDFNSWSSRFQMGDRPGTSLSRCSGRKEARLDALPQSYLALGQRVHPQVFANPAAALSNAAT